jgi:citrate lyase gamma subunit
MALKKDFEFTKDGFTGTLVSKDAYIKVESVGGTKSSVSAEVSVTSSDGKLIEKAYHSFVPNLDGANFIKQAYQHFKTLPAFAGATDC